MLNRILFYINIVAAFGLLLAGYSIYISPEKFWIPAFFGLAYTFILIINCVFILTWLIFLKQKRNILISIIAILLTWSSFSNVFNFSVASRSASELSIMTWNVKNFDLYNWSHNKETHELMMQLLEEEKPDILCLQEFYTETKGDFKNIAELKKRLGYKYYYFGETFSILKGTKKWGLVTFSKYPIKDHGIIKFENSPRLNACIYTDIAYAKDSVIRIYNTHLQSIHFGDDDYKYFSDLKADQKADVEGSKKIVRKIRNGFEKRVKQAELIKSHANDFNGKTIICGDFNDTSSSFTYKTLSRNMKDAFTEKGFGFGNTWVNPSPFFRIDFMLVDKSIVVNSYTTITEELSDHYAVKVILDIK